MAVRILGNPQLDTIAVARAKSDYHALLAQERDMRSKTRGYCSACGHLWTPRNPYKTHNRCPSCSLRGQVTWTTFRSEVEPDEAKEARQHEAPALSPEANPTEAVEAQPIAPERG